MIFETQRGIRSDSFCSDSWSCSWQAGVPTICWSTRSTVEMSQGNHTATDVVDGGRATVLELSHTGFDSRRTSTGQWQSEADGPCCILICEVCRKGYDSNEIPKVKRTLKKACSSPWPVCLSTSMSLQVDTFDFATISDPQANIMASRNRDE
jgi:hypothetical protein